MTSKPTSIELKLLLDYDPETGDLFWKENGHKRKAGKKAGSLHSKGYTTIWANGRNHKSHRVIWAIHYGEWPTQDIDHIDRDRMNNRIANLRQVTKRQNACNTVKRPQNKSGYKGVVFSKPHNRWKAQITTQGKVIYLGLFDNIEDAKDAYIKACDIYHDGYGHQNFPSG